MSASGYLQTFPAVWLWSALSLEADVGELICHVAKGQERKLPTTWIQPRQVKLFLSFMVLPVLPRNVMDFQVAGNSRADGGKVVLG